MSINWRVEDFIPDDLKEPYEWAVDKEKRLADQQAQSTTQDKDRPK